MPRSAVSVVTYVKKGKFAEQERRLTFTAKQWADESPSLLGDPDFRRKRKIRWLRAVVFDAKGNVTEELLRAFDERGKTIGEKKMVVAKLKFGTIAQARKSIAAHWRRAEFPKSFKRRLVQELVKPQLAKGNNVTQLALALELPPPTLIRWAHAFGALKKKVPAREPPPPPFTP